MVLIDSVKYACATCIKGHRSSTCNHDTRPLIEIKKKGRPVTQCVHCRELRKTKQVHVKCLCEGRPETSSAAPRTVLPAVLTASALTPSPTTAASSTTVSRAGSTSGDSSCDCKTNGGSCECCTPKHAPRQQAAANGGANTKPPGLTRGHTYHASSSSTTSMNHDAGHHRTVGSKQSGALQRSVSLHGATGPGTSSSSAQSSNSYGTHHPQPQHHPARHFAPYQVAHHSHHHHHARFDLPEEDDAEDLFPTSDPSNAADISEGIPRRPRRSSVANGDLARPFPPSQPMYLNSTATMSLPDVLAWNSGDVNPMPSFNQQQGGSQQSLADASRPTSAYLPSSAPEFDTYSVSSADDLINQFGSANNQIYDEPMPTEGYSANSNDVQFGTSGLPGFRFASVDVTGLDPMDDASGFEYNDAALAYGVSGAVPTSTDYDAVMATLLSLPQQAIPSYGSGSGTVGSSGPPSMTGSLTSRSSSRASGGLPSALEMLEMTSSNSADTGADRARAPRGFPPIADPFENEATTAIPSYDAFERPLQQPPRSLAVLDIEKSVSHSHSPMSQDSVSSAQDDGSGTQFPAWPQQHSPLSTTAISSGGSVPASSTSGYSPFDPISAFEYQTPASATALMYPGQRRPALDFDDSAWIQRS